MSYCRPFKRGVSWRSQNFADNPNNGTNGAGGHTGNDDAAPIGSEVHAAGDGVIEYAGQFDDTYADNLLWLIDFGGNILVLNCGDAEPTFVYAHLSRFLVKPGDRVRKGQVIALSGNSGTRTTGPHLHNEAIAPGYVLNGPTLGRVNPDLYLTEWPDDVGGIAAMGESIKPIQEDDVSAQEVMSWPIERTDGQESTVAVELARLGPDLAAVKSLLESLAPKVDESMVNDRKQVYSLEGLWGAVASTPAPDIAAKLNAAGIAADVRDELVKLLGGK